MAKKLVIICFVISLSMLVGGAVWKAFDPESDTAILVYFQGWIASLLAVGYMSTPNDSIYGKIAFAFVCIIVAGVVMKFLHLQAANEIIIGGLLGLGSTYVVRAFKE